MFNANKGYSLIELLVVIAIITILAVMARPAYLDHQARQARTHAKGSLLDIAKQLTSWQLANNNAGVTAAQFNQASPSGVLSQVGSAMRYNLVFAPQDDNGDGVNDYWLIRATPQAGTAFSGNGMVCIDSLGQKFWQQGATACALSQTSTWDNN